MRATFGDNKSIFLIDSLPDAGRFALDTVPPKQPSWDHCREQFSHKLDPNTVGLFFSHYSGQAENVAGFMAKCEEVLDLETRSHYRRTYRDTVMWVEPTSFWLDCWMKRSFLTILLRCGMYYDPDRDNFEEALFGYGDDKDKAREYTYQTKLAVMRFFFGFTKFVQPPGVDTPSGTLQKTLWVEVFRDRSVKELKTILVADKPILGFGAVGADAIWA